MARYIRFTVTPTDGSPYTQWVNADSLGRGLFMDFSRTANQSVRYIMGQAMANGNQGLSPTPPPPSINNRGNVFVIPTSTNPAIQVLSSAASWWSAALGKLEETPPQVMFIDADGIPACGVAGLDCNIPDIPT